MTKFLLVLVGLIAYSQALRLPNPNLQLPKQVRNPSLCGRSLLGGGIEQVRFGQCIDQPCNVYPGKNFDFEVDFVSSSAYFLNTELVVSIMGVGHDGDFKAMDFEPMMVALPTEYDPRGALFPMTSYTVKYSINLPFEFELNDFVLKAELYGTKMLNKQQELCVYIDVNNQILF